MNLKRIQIILLACCVSSLANAGPISNSEVLEKIWVIGQTESCSQEMRNSFDLPTLNKLKTQLRSALDREDLSRILNPFLFSLGYSHTQFFTDKMESFYLFRGYYSLVDPQAPPAPKIISPGVQIGFDGRGYYLTNVLNGFPAEAAGFVKGDRILTVDDIPFSGFWGFVPKPNAKIRMMRKGKPRYISVELKEMNWAHAFYKASLNSIQILLFNRKRVGYVRLWSGVHPKSAEVLWVAVKKFKEEHVDGVVLDLRDGYGGAFWSHLDPFFENRNDYFIFTSTDGDGNAETLRPPPQTNPDAYSGPMVVLINEGSRSGKEALAYQFKKSQRAILIGTSTPGYFSAGGMFFMDEPLDYMLYLCVRKDAQLDGVDVEGIGIAPDIAVPFDDRNIFGDSQLKAGLELLSNSKFKF